ncbi:MAG: hypothetical protein WEG40_23680 [Candidatus Rokuibacteriota bacterium]
MRPSARSRSSKRKAEVHQEETAERAAAASEQLRWLTALRVRLALDIVGAGFKSVAMKHHPDKGGSSETMAILLQVRTDLNEIIEEFYE